MQGIGRVGKVMAKKLTALGADVTVSARKQSDFAWIAQEGMKSVHTGDLALYAGGFDLIINTVPTVVLTEDVTIHTKGRINAMATIDTKRVFTRAE